MGVVLIDCLRPEGVRHKQKMSTHSHRQGGYQVDTESLTFLSRTSDSWETCWEMYCLSIYDLPCVI